MPKFKVGDYVRNIETGKEDVVFLLPGMPEYDEKNFASALMGMYLVNHGWEFQVDWELVEPKVKTKTKKEEKVEEAEVPEPDWSELDNNL